MANEKRESPQAHDMPEIAGEYLLAIDTGTDPAHEAAKAELARERYRKWKAEHPDFDDSLPF